MTLFDELAAIVGDNGALKLIAKFSKAKPVKFSHLMGNHRGCDLVLHIVTKHKEGAGINKTADMLNIEPNAVIDVLEEYLTYELNN